MVALPLVVAVAVAIWFAMAPPDATRGIVAAFLVKQGKPLPDLAVEDAAGKGSSLRDLEAGRRRVVLLMEAECPHCHTELALLRQLRAEPGTTLGPVVVLAVGDPVLFPRLAQNYADLPMYLDANREIRRKYRLEAVPAMLVVDPAGSVTEVRVGLQPKDALRDLLAPPAAR